jgi:hypothetical protein
MKRTNFDVIMAWVDGMRSCAENLRTDGRKLYSYGLCIGDRLPDGRKVVYVYTPRGLGFISMTTRIHVGLAKPHADVLVTREEEFRALTGTTTWDAVRDAYCRRTEIMNSLKSNVSRGMHAG